MYRLHRHERFQDARLEYNIHGRQTMDEVAEATGLSKNMISDLENPEKDRDVGYKSIAKLAKHYAISMDWLMGFTSDIEVSPGELEDLGISGESKDMILRKLKDNRELASFSNFINDMVEIGVSPEMRLIYDALIGAGRQNVYFGGFCDFGETQTEVAEAIDTLGFTLISPKEAINYYACKIAELIKHTIITKYRNAELIKRAIIPDYSIGAQVSGEEIKRVVEQAVNKTLLEYSDYLRASSNEKRVPTDTPATGRDDNRG